MRYDAVGLRRLYLGGIGTYVPGLLVILAAGVAIAYLAIHGINGQAPRFDPNRRDIVFDNDPAVRNLETLLAVATACAAVLGVIALISGAACYFVLLYRAWALIRDDRSGPRPGRAVGLLFVPFFNLYWVFVGIWGLARRLNRFAHRYDLETPTASQPLGFAISVYSVLTYLPIPFAGLVPLGLNLILWPFFMRSVYRTAASFGEDANRERIAHPSLDCSLRQSDLPRPVSAHILSTIATVLTPIGVALLVIGFGTGLNALRHFDRDTRMIEVQRQAIDHMRRLNPPDPNRLRQFEDGANGTQQLLMRWRWHLITSAAVLGGGVLLLVIAIALAHVSRLCARGSEDAVPPEPSAWPAPHGVVSSQ